MAWRKNKVVLGAIESLLSPSLQVLRGVISDFLIWERGTYFPTGENMSHLGK